MGNRKEAEMELHRERVTGGQAFPTPETDSEHRVPGMTLRDYFAGANLAGMLANPQVLRDDRPEIMISAVEMADDLIKELAKEVKR